MWLRSWNMPGTVLFPRGASEVGSASRPSASRVETPPGGDSLSSGAKDGFLSPTLLVSISALLILDFVLSQAPTLTHT